MDSPSAIGHDCCHLQKRTIEEAVKHWSMTTEESHQKKALVHDH
jgi:hypothetical protein